MLRMWVRRFFRSETLADGHVDGLKFCSRDHSIVQSATPTFVEIGPEFAGAPIFLDHFKIASRRQLQKSIQQLMDGFARKERLDQWLDDARCSVPGANIAP